MSAVTRIRSIDVIRGIVMVLMAIDHVRVYSGIPAGGPSPGVFFTRWVTHFCAPAFVFLAGTGAYLHGRQVPRGALAKYLVTRGLLLIVLEFTLIRLSWTFHVDYSQFILAGVIWMLGWCMVLLAALIWLPTTVVAIFGLVVMFAQNVFGVAGEALPASLHRAWEFLYPIGAEVRLTANGPNVAVLYTIVPWIGVMAAGYAFGAVAARNDASRRRWFLRIGITATVLFVALSGLQTYFTAPRPGAPPWWIRMLNQEKYPASQFFLLMTLGPAIAGLAWAERAHNWIARAFETFGRVPMFYYLLHIPLIHATALAVFYVRDGAINTAYFNTAPYVGMPPAARWSLGTLYGVFLLDVVLLYFACRWFARMKSTRGNKWLRYL